MGEGYLAMEASGADAFAAALLHKRLTEAARADAVRRRAPRSPLLLLEPASLPPSLPPSFPPSPGVRMALLRVSCSITLDHS